VAALHLTPEDEVLEIGPGTGALTRHLAEQAGRVIAIEKDDELAARLQAEFADGTGVTIVHGDALETDLRTLVHDPARVKVVGNIPYNITSPLIFHLLESGLGAERIVIMVQREVADRILAATNLHRLEVQAPKEPAPRFDLGGDQGLVATPHPLGGEVDLHSRAGLRILDGGQAERRELLLGGVAQNDGDQLVAPRRHLQSRFEVRTEKVAEEKDDGAPSDHATEVVKRPGDVGASPFGLRSEDAGDERHPVLLARLRGNEGFDAIGKEDGTHAVAAADGGKDQQRRELGGEAALRPVHRAEVQ